MPLDDTGFHRPIDGPDNKGLLIISDRVSDHRLHDTTSCMVSFWAAAAAVMLADKKGLPANTIYTATASEVTTGHIDRYRGNIMVLGIMPGFLSPTKEAPIPPPDKDEVEKSLVVGILGISLPGRFYFPDTLETIAQTKERYFVAAARQLSHLIVGETILPPWRSRDRVVALADSSQEYQFRPG